MIGKLIDECYRLDSELGRGGMGVVYRAHDTLLDRDVAVKVLSDTTLDAKSRARLLREAQAAAELNHSNTVSIYDAGEAEGVPFIVMELVEGESLGKHRPKTLEGILSIARQVCAALEHAHTSGVIHCDLKPENVLITPDGSARLVDSGLARTAASRLTAEGTIAGTVFYFAPEQALGQTIDSRVDLYALGVVLYELTAERLPFTGDDLLTVISQHVHAPVVPPSSYNAAIPPALDALIVQLLSKRPEDRPASAAKVRQSLDDLSPPEADVGLDHMDYGWAVALYDESLTPARELSDKEVIARLLLPPGETMPQIEVLLVDDHALFREGLAGLLSSQPDMKVVGEAGDGLEAWLWPKNCSQT